MSRYEPVKNQNIFNFKVYDFEPKSIYRNIKTSLNGEDPTHKNKCLLERDIKSEKLNLRIYYEFIVDDLKRWFTLVICDKCQMYEIEKIIF